jgi:hypothetical protein
MFPLTDLHSLIFYVKLDCYIIPLELHDVGIHGARISSPDHISKRWPFSADTGPEIINIHIKTNNSVHILLVVCENSSIRNRHTEKIEISNNLQYQEINTANENYLNPL